MVGGGRGGLETVAACIINCNVACLPSKEMQKYRRVKGGEREKTKDS